MKTDPRVEHTRTVVIQAAVDLLAEEGFERITIDRVADRSGVARSTIYRNWPDRQQLLIDSFQRVCTTEPLPDTGSLAGDLGEIAQRLAHGLGADLWGRMIPSLIGAAAHDPDLKRAQARFTQSRRAQIHAVVERAVARGEVPVGAGTETAVLRFCAPLFYRRLFTDDPLDDAFVADLVAATVRELSELSDPEPV